LGAREKSAKKDSTSEEPRVSFLSGFVSKKRGRINDEGEHKVPGRGGGGGEPRRKELCLGERPRQATACQGTLGLASSKKVEEQENQQKERHSFLSLQTRGRKERQGLSRRKEAARTDLTIQS